MTWVRRVWGGRGDGEYGLSGQRGDPHLSPNGFPFACLSQLCVCVFAYSHIIHLLNNMSVGLHAFA